MKLKNSFKEEIKFVIKKCLNDKFESYKPESTNMPFHFRLLGKDRMALYSFIHSLNTTFGTSIFEPVAVRIAQNNFKIAKRQFTVGTNISEYAQREIQHILNNLSINGNPNKTLEIKSIRKNANKGKINKIKVIKADLFLVDKNDNVFLIDIKTVKPNISNFKDFKRTLLEWIAVYLYENPNAQVNSFISIPYNPYEPKPYERWTLKGMIDLKKELMIADEFWNFLGGLGCYDILLKCFEEVGIEMRDTINYYFLKFR